MKRDEDADPDDCSEQELQQPTPRARSMRGAHRTDGDDDIASDTITLELVNTYRDQARQLRTQVRRLQRENDDFRTQVDKLSARLEEEAAVQSRKKDTTAEDLQKQLGEMRLELEAKSAELEAKSVELEAKSAELEESRRHKDNLASQLTERTTEQQGVSATPPSNALAFFVAQLAEKSTEVTKARQESERLQKALERSVTERDQKIVKMEHELDRERERVLAQAEENGALNEELRSLQVDQESFTRAGRNEHDINRQVKERPDREREERNRESQLAKENRKLLERICVLEMDIDTLKGRLRGADDSARSANSQEKTPLEEELRNANALLIERTARLANLEQENQQLGTELAEIRQIEATYIQQLAEMDGTNSELRAVITSLTKRNENDEREVYYAVEHAQQEYASQLEISRMLREELEHANKRIEELEHMTASNQGNRNADQQRITSLERELADARRQLENCQRRLMTAEHEVEEIRKGLIDRQKEVDYLSTENARILSEADADKRAIERLEEEIVKMRRASQSRPTDETSLRPQTSAANHYAQDTYHRDSIDDQSAATASPRFTPVANVRVNPTNATCHLCGIRKRNGFYRPCGHGGCRECLEKYLTRMKGLCVACRAPAEIVAESYN